MQAEVDLGLVASVARSLDRVFLLTSIAPLAAPKYRGWDRSWSVYRRRLYSDGQLGSRRVKEQRDALDVGSQRHLAETVRVEVVLVLLDLREDLQRIESGQALFLGNKKRERTLKIWW